MTIPIIYPFTPIQEYYLLLNSTLKNSCKIIDLFENDIIKEC